MVVKCLSQGGMGAVYEARDSHLRDDPCAIKELRLDVKDTEYLQSKFEAEVDVLLRLQHPGIPRVRAYYTEGSARYIVMDFVPGRNLEEELEESLHDTGKGLERSRVLRDILRVLEVLTYLHEHDPPILHRDVKPANLVRDSKSGQVKLVDFGLARDHTPQSEAHTMVGTPGYAPPEQWLGLTEPRSDLFAVGVTLHVLLTGTPPRNQGVSTDELLALPEPLRTIVEKATQSQCDSRYANAREMAEAIRELMGESTVKAPTVLIDMPARRTRPWLGGGIGLVLLAVAAYVIFGARHAPPGGPGPTPAEVPTTGAAASPRRPAMGERASPKTSPIQVAVQPLADLGVTSEMPTGFQVTDLTRRGTEGAELEAALPDSDRSLWVWVETDQCVSDEGELALFEDFKHWLHSEKWVVDEISNHGLPNDHQMSARAHGPDGQTALYFNQVYRLSPVQVRLVTLGALTDEDDEDWLDSAEVGSFFTSVKMKL